MGERTIGSEKPARFSGIRLGVVIINLPVLAASEKIHNRAARCSLPAVGHAMGELPWKPVLRKRMAEESSTPHVPDLHLDAMRQSS